MVKKAGLIIAAAAAGLLMIGGPAFAGEPGDGGSGGGGSWPGGHGDLLIEDHADPQVGLVNLQGIDVAKDINLNAVIGACGNQVLAIPLLSPPATGSCASGGIVD